MVGVRAPFVLLALRGPASARGPRSAPHAPAPRRHPRSPLPLSHWKGGGGEPPHNVMGLEEACELLKGDLPFSRPSPKKNGWILVMNNQNSQQSNERHICSPREVRWGCDEEE